MWIGGEIFAGGTVTKEESAEGPGGVPVPLSRVIERLREADLLEEVHPGVDDRPPGEGILTGAAQDSRQVVPGRLFLAWRGTARDGHDFVPDAVARGAVAAVVERFVPGVEVPQLRVSDGRRAAALAAMVAVGDPATGMLVTAVTGTNGKTTTVLLIRHLLAGKGKSAALGTLGVVSPDGEVRDGSGGLTTPGPVALAETLQAFREEGVTAVSVEASSHALEQRRLDGLRVDAACFTNLTRDHLDYHGTMGAYLRSKARLLDLLAPGGIAVVNGRDPAWAGLPPIPGALLFVRMEGGGVPGLPVARDRLPDLTAREMAVEGEGSRFVLEERGEVALVHLPLLGRFNVENALAAAGVARAVGMPLHQIAERLSQAPPIPGRVEVVVTEPVPVIVDYAHTPDALARLLDGLRPLYPGRLIVVFGAGGDRDRAKRPEMGEAVARRAEVSIVTSDNPRTEDPARIVDEVVAGMGGARLERILDRREAIARALELARPGDAVVVAGKGHETYQIVGPEVRPFDDRAVVRDLLGRGRAP